MAIDTGKTKDSLFGNIAKKGAPKPQPQEPDAKQEVEAQKPPPPQEMAKADPPAKESSPPKYQTFAKVTALLTTEQKDGLDRIAKKIMRHRAKEIKGQDNRERITANTLIRALIDNFLDREEAAQVEVLSSEEDAHAWVRKVLRK
jgi:hypothetical protein